MSGGEDIQIVRNTHGTGSARGWNALVEALTTAKTYRVTIRQTADRIVLTFPGGDANMLSAEFALDPGPHASVVNRGDFWTKSVGEGNWTSDGTLVLASVTFSGWWKNGPPDTAKAAATDYHRRFVLTRGARADELRLRVAVADEKGELEYVQSLHRLR